MCGQASCLGCRLPKSASQQRTRYLYLKRRGQIQSPSGHRRHYSRFLLQFRRQQHQRKEGKQQHHCSGMSGSQKRPRQRSSSKSGRGVHHRRIMEWQLQVAQGFHNQNGRGCSELAMSHVGMFSPVAHCLVDCLQADLVFVIHSLEVCWPTDWRNGSIKMQKTKLDRSRAFILGYIQRMMQRRLVSRSRCSIALRSHSNTTQAFDLTQLSLANQRGGRLPTAGIHLALRPLPNTTPTSSNMLLSRHQLQFLGHARPWSAGSTPAHRPLVLPSPNHDVMHDRNSGPTPTWNSGSQGAVACHFTAPHN